MAMTRQAGKSHSLALLAFGSLFLVNGFIPQQQQQQHAAFYNKESTCITPSKTISSTSSSSSRLYGVPPMIIGPMIRKMRKEQEKKKMPMATQEESYYEAPGLRVGKSAWKWPPIWPYDQATFTPKVDLQQQESAANQAMSNFMGGGAAMPDPEQIKAMNANKEEFDPIAWWSQEKESVLTDMDPDAVEKLQTHYAFYIKDGMSVLELGAAEKSYLPEGVQLKRHVGIGANMKLMEQNEALTERHVVDLNKVEEEKGVDSEVLKQLSLGESFDVVIMANTVDFLTHPREVFRSAWYLVKPGGTMIVAFSNKEYYAQKFERAQTKMWRDYTDDQHMWICGSFFQFSAGEGWTNLRGFDISPDNAKNVDDKGPFRALKGGKDNNLFVVQADRNVADETIDEEDPEKSFRSKMWMLPTLEDRDKQLVAPRLRRIYEQLDDDEGRENLLERVDYLPKIYECLIKMDQFAFTFTMQAQLAANLVADPNFNANDEQILSLKQGLGLRTPAKEFWAPVGQLTSAMPVDEKISLLAHIVPRFGSGDSQQEECLEAFATGLTPTFDVIRSKCPSWNDADIQLVGTELLAAEILKPGQSTREEFAKWLGELTAQELETVLTERRQVASDANVELEKYREEKAEQIAAYEAKQEKMKEQIQTARENRSMRFDPKTGKFEAVKK